jgi:hypothetical protein
MARKSRMSIMKRQREVQKAEKAAMKRAKRHGKTLDLPPEPMPTASLASPADPAPDGAGDDAEPPDPARRRPPAPPEESL